MTETKKSESLESESFETTSPNLPIGTDRDADWRKQKHEKKTQHKRNSHTHSPDSSSVKPTKPSMPPETQLVNAFRKQVKVFWANITG